LLCTGFGVGFLPRVPGTWGSLLGIGLWWVVFRELGPASSTLVVGLTIGFAWLVIRQTCRAYNVEDEPAIVIDEIVGQWIALLWVPRSLWVVCLAFLLFRFLDITKPWPVSWADRSVRGPLGILLDDVIAGMATCIVVHVVVRVLA
jgi:phosphatidylglycerophosphatase A